MRHLLLFAAFTVLTTPAWTQNQPEPTEVRFRDAGLARGDALAALPADWTALVRLMNVDRSVARLDALYAAFMTEELLPDSPDRKQALLTPFSTLVGSGTKFGSLSRTVLMARAGFDSARPILLAWYAGDEIPNSEKKLKEGMILAFPSSGDLARTASFLVGLFDGEMLTEESLDGKPMVSMISPFKTGRIFLACSADCVYVAGSMRVMGALLGGGPRLSKDAALRMLGNSESEDLSAAVNFSLLTSPKFYDLAMYEGIAKSLVGEGRKNVDRLSASRRLGLARGLSRFLGIATPEDALALGEIALLSGVREIVPELRSRMLSNQGVSLGVVFLPEGTRSRLSWYRSDLAPARQAAPIPLETVKQALSRIPGSRDTLVITGRQAAGMASTLPSRIVERMARMAGEKGIAWPFLTRAREWLIGVRHTPPLESRFSYAITFANDHQARPAAPLLNRSPLEAQVLRWLGRLNEPWTTLVPVAERGGLERYLGELATNRTQDERAWDRLWYGSNASTAFFRSSSRFRMEAPTGLAQQLVYEDAITMNFGLFSYDQYEWVSRRHFHLRPRNEDAFFQESRLPSPWLTGESEWATRPVDGGLARLVACIPAGAHTVVIDRRLSRLPAFLGELSDLEDAMAAELDGFLAAAQKQVDAAGGDGERAGKLVERLPAPFLVTGLYLDENGKVYCRLGGSGGPAYPRPRVARTVREFLSGFSPTNGGGGVFAATSFPDREEFTFQQDLRAMALLWTTGVRSLAGRVPEGNMERKLDVFLRKFTTPFDSKGGRLLASWPLDFFGVEAFTELIKALERL